MKLKHRRMHGHIFAFTDVKDGRYIPGERIDTTLLPCFKCTIQEYLDYLDYFNASAHDRAVLGLTPPTLFQRILDKNYG